MQNNIILIAEHVDKKISPVTFELIACARTLTHHIALPVKILLAGHKIDTIANQLAGEAGLDVIVVPAGDPSETQSEIFKNLSHEDLIGLHPRYIFMANNSFGSEIASALAIRMDAACVTGVEKISVSEDHICFRRKIFNDKVATNVTSTAPVPLLTIQPGSFKPVCKTNDGKGNIFFLDVQFRRYPIKHIGYASAACDTSNLTEAEVIVSVGNGIGKVENIDLMYQLAGLFPKSSVAGSRPVCDRKWLEYSRQVGATGATVKPKLYLACGISGASQHVTGMKDSKLIVAINIDSHAAIFQNADICIIENLESFIPLLIDTYQSE